MRKVGKVIEVAIITIVAVALLWMTLSVGEIMIKNISEQPVYSQFNLIEMLMSNQ